METALIFICMYAVLVASMVTMATIVAGIFFNRKTVKRRIKMMVKVFIKEVMKEIDKTEDDD